MKLAMITKGTLLMLAVASVAFTSCKKEKGGSSDPGEQSKKISRIEENGQLTASFTYNADGTLKTLYTADGSYGSMVFEFSYNAQKKISQVTSTEGGLFKYSYENGLLTHVDNYIGTEKIAENAIQYENGRAKSNTYLTAQPNGGGGVTFVPTFRTVYHYTANGAVQKISTYVLGMSGQLELEHEYAYEQYDGKKNPLAVVSDFSQAFLYQPISPSNPLVEKWYTANGSVDETTQNEYTYDDAGYPVTIKSTTISAGSTTPTVRTSKLFY